MGWCFDRLFLGFCFRCGFFLFLFVYDFLALYRGLLRRNVGGWMIPFLHFLFFRFLILSVLMNCRFYTFIAASEHPLISVYPVAMPDTL